MGKTTKYPVREPSFKPSPAIGKRYDIIVSQPVHYVLVGNGRRQIDLRTISLKLADLIVKNGFPFLVETKKAQNTKNEN